MLAEGCVGSVGCDNLPYCCNKIRRLRCLLLIGVAGPGFLVIFRMACGLFSVGKWDWLADRVAFAPTDAT
jgi:hypothetical protein